jgi:hypothetical protein
MKPVTAPSMEWRFNVADPTASVPAALLAPDGRYSCDRCDGLCERADLTELPEGFICPECIVEQL